MARFPDKTAIGPGPSLRVERRMMPDIGLDTAAVAGDVAAKTIALAGGIWEKHENDKEAADAEYRFQAFQDDWRKNLLARQQSAEPGAPGFMEGVTGDYVKGASDFLPTLPRRLQGEFKTRLKAFESQVTTSADLFARKEAERFGLERVDDLRNRHLIGVSQPGGDPEAAIRDFNLMVDRSPGISPATKDKAKHDFAAQAREAHALGQIERDPAAASRWAGQRFDSEVVLSAAAAVHPFQVPQQFAPQVRAAASKYGVPIHVLASTFWNESRWDPNAVNKNDQGPGIDSVGIGQWGEQFAKQRGFDPRDPNASIEHTAQALSEYATRYGGNYLLARLAYGWGPGNVDKWLKDGGDPNKVPDGAKVWLPRTALGIADDKEARAAFPQIAGSLRPGPVRLPDATVPAGGTLTDGTPGTTAVTPKGREFVVPEGITYAGFQRLKAAAEKAANRNELQMRVDLEGDYADAAASIARFGHAGNIDINGLFQRGVAAGMTARQIEKMRGGIQLARDTFEIQSQVATAAADDLKTLEQRYAVQPGAGAQESAARAELFRKAVAARDAALKADSPSYIFQNMPNVRQAYEAAQQGKDPALWDKAFDTMREAQAHFGVIPKVRKGDPVDVPLLPPTMAASIVADIAKADGQQRSAKLDGLQAQFGPAAFARLWPQLVKAGLPSDAIAAAQIDPGNASAKQAMGVAVTEGPALLKAMAPPDKRSLEEGVDGAMREFVATVQPGVAGSAGLKSVQDQRAAAINLAAVYHRGGMSPADAAKKAVDDLINHKYQYLSGGMWGPGVRVPSAGVGPGGQRVAFDTRTLEDYTLDFMSRLKLSDIQLPAGFEQDIKALGEDAVRERVLSDRTLIWVNNPSDTGVYLFRAQSGMPLLSKDGRPIEIKWGDVPAGFKLPVPTLRGPARPPQINPSTPPR